LYNKREMAEENKPYQNFGNQPNYPTPLGTGEGEVPLSTPPQLNVEVRTMTSDLKSLNESGGSAPRPYTPSTSVPNTNEASSQPPAPKSEVFVPPPADFTESNKSTPPAAPLPVPPKSNNKKFLFIAVISFLIIVGLGALGYFVIYPKFFGDRGTVEIPTAQNNQPAETETQQPPAAENLLPPPPPIEEPQLPPPPPPSPPSTITSHSSFFKKPVELTADITLQKPIGETTLADLKQTLSRASQEVPPFTEFTIKDSTSALASFYAIARLIAPNTFNDAILQSFENDFTFFIYTDNNGGNWPGFIAKTKTAPTEKEITAISRLETNNEASSFFLADPGAPSTWKNGQVNNKPARYLPFSKAGASLSYTWFDNYLLISTNYAGAQEAAKHLGY
jgi:hypothetical protein